MTWLEVKRLEGLLNPGGKKKKKKKHLSIQTTQRKVRAKSMKPVPSYFVGANHVQLQNSTTWETFCNFHNYVLETAEDGKIIWVGVSRE